jgi:hypothetical protein
MKEHHGHGRSGESPGLKSSDLSGSVTALTADPVSVVRRREAYQITISLSSSVLHGAIR